MNKLDFTPLSKLVDDTWGKKGTPERDKMEAKLKEEMEAYFLGETIKKARLKQNISQQQLGEKIGVQRAQICKLEKGISSPTIATVKKVFKALGINTATLDLGEAGKITLW